MSQRYQIKYIRLKPSGSNTHITDDRVIQLYKWGCTDYAYFKIINDFFNTTRQNRETKDTIKCRLENLKQEQEVINGLVVNRYSFKKLKEIILELFENTRISNDEYQIIYSDYLEYITMQWKKIPGRYGKVVYEPLIKYKRRELFGGRDFANSKCDVVYKNTRKRNLSIYECKFGLSTFVSHLRVDIIRETNRNLLRKGRRAHRKIDYLKECERIFSSNLLSDVEDSEIRIVTLATRSSIPQESLRILEGITLITRENIEDLSFYNHMKT